MNLRLRIETPLGRHQNRNCLPGPGRARKQCIIKGRPASEGGSLLCRRRRSICLYRNRKTERCDCVVERECWAVPGGGGFAPAPPGFIALVPVPMRGLYKPLVKKGCRSLPPRSVEAAESALGLLPSIALSSAQLRLIITAVAGAGACPSQWVREYGTLPWGKDPR